MGKAGSKPGKKIKGGTKASEPSRRPPPSPQDDEYYEDGDIATPKLDRYGNDDEPL